MAKFVFRFVFMYVIYFNYRSAIQFHILWICFLKQLACPWRWRKRIPDMYMLGVTFTRRRI